MTKNLFTLIPASLICLSSLAFSGPQEQLDTILPIRGFCIAAPRPAGLAEFIKFIDEELAPAKVNTLILRVDYNYQYESHPELRDSSALSKNDVRKLVAACRKNNIRIIPQVNLLGHQSWAGTVGNLLRVYPEFDETPLVLMPEKYVWPNPDGLYCKSYCPLHPGVHDIVFDLIDEICDVFETDAFHAGMDEVFYIGERQCPRCAGRDPSELFAGEVRTLRDHLSLKGRKLWIWGDRLIDGRTTGLGEWEASYNNTWRAVDMIPKDVVICDWHYERPDKTPVYFAMKGLSVVTCPWRMPDNAVLQVHDMVNFRNHSTPEMKERFLGMVQTVWSGAEQFLGSYYGRRKEDGNNTPVNCFRALYKEIGKLDR
ncbi:MAG: family 20 glycosylhydrolase [Bacteroidales bacterium]|nr:family 20 glycosylhydrolase [Bacteroidales bacterium]